MGQPTGRKGPVTLPEYIGQGGKRGELKHLSTRRNRKKDLDSPSSGERNGNSPNRMCVKAQGVAHSGSRDLSSKSCNLDRSYKSGPSRTVWKDRPQKVTALYVKGKLSEIVSQVAPDT